MTSAIDSHRPADVLLAVTEETTRRSLIPLLQLGGFEVRLARGEAEALAAETRVHEKVRELCARFPIYAARR